jgi:hypothetical protein
MRLQKIISILSCISALLLATAGSAQIDSATSASPYGGTPVRSSGFKLKPRLGLGLGSLVMYGDIGRDNKGYHPGSADMAYTLYLTNDVNAFIDVSVYTVFGTININEYTAERALNLQSQVRSGGFMVSYNFDHFLPSNRSADPYISIGLESFEFLSKTDLFDAEGRRYHYWSDGSIRDLAQDASNADDAIYLTRDYVYETDLRELNQDGFGRYTERSFGIPVAAGVQFRVTDRFRARLGTRFIFTFTDLVDNMTEESNAERKGNARNDNFLFTSFSLNYDLNPLREREKRNDDPYSDGEEDLLASDDSDGDGVPDIKDKCSGTPAGVQVDANGCPLDSDGDGIADYLDSEPNSPHTYVDADGVALDDTAIYERYLMWHDSIPWTGGPILNEDHARVDSDMSRQKDNFRIRVPRDSDGMSQDNINTLLAQSDVTSTIDNGEEVFLVGNFEALPDAVKRKVELNRSGISSTVVNNAGADGSLSPVEIDLAWEAQIAEEMAYDEDDNEVHFRVQVGAFRQKLSNEIFASIGDVISVRGADGLTRYLTQSFETMSGAASRKTELLTMGFTDAFITAYRGGERIKLADAGMTVVNTKKDVLTDSESNLVDPSLVKFRVVLGDYEGDIPTDQLDLLLEIGNIRPQRQSNGRTHFLSPVFDSLDEAQKLFDRAKEMGVTAPRMIGEFNKKPIPFDDALKLKKVGPQQVMVD